FQPPGIPVPIENWDPETIVSDEVNVFAPLNVWVDDKDASADEMFTPERCEPLPKKEAAVIDDAEVMKPPAPERVIELPLAIIRSAVAVNVLLCAPVPY